MATQRFPVTIHPIHQRCVHSGPLVLGAGFLKPFTTKALGEAISESIKRYEQAEDKTEFCDPDVPITLYLNGKRQTSILS